MTTPVSIILAASVAALIAGVIRLQLVQVTTRRIVASGCLIVLAAGVYVLAKTSSVETKGPMDEAIAVFFCYAAMLLGMTAEYGYRLGERGRRRAKMNWMEFMMPIFASPIVFIPLLTITADLSVSGALAKSKLMVYLVAFQNGFFWRTFFEQRRQAASEFPVPSPAAPARARAAAAK